MKKTTKMRSSDPLERSAAMAARVHRLSDPLAAMGQRSHGSRLRQESKARVALLAITLTATIAVTGVIAVLDEPSTSGDAGVAYQSPANQSERPVHIRSGSS